MRPVAIRRRCLPRSVCNQDGAMSELRQPSQGVQRQALLPSDQLVPPDAVSARYSPHPAGLGRDGDSEDRHRRDHDPVRRHPPFAAAVASVAMLLFELSASWPQSIEPTCLRVRIRADHSHVGRADGQCQAGKESCAECRFPILQGDLLRARSLSGHPSSIAAWPAIAC